jgi:tetratricopeptide (TPR) repeat protein
MRLSRILIVVGLTSALQVGVASAQNSAAQKNLSDCQSGDRNADLAITACTALLKNDNGNPAFGDVYYNRGYAYEMKKQYDLAIADYSQAIKRKPDFTIAYANRGYDYAMKEKYDDAIRDFDQALKLNPKSGFSLIHRGNAYAKKGQYQRAIQDYDAVLVLAPKTASAFYGRGLAKIQLGDKAGGEADIARAKSFDSKIGR